MDSEQEILLLFKDGAKIYEHSVRNALVSRVCRQDGQTLIRSSQSPAPKVLAYMLDNKKVVIVILTLNAQQLHSVEHCAYPGAVFRLYLSLPRFDSNVDASKLSLFVEDGGSVLVQETAYKPMLVMRTLSSHAGLALLDETDLQAVKFRRVMEPLIYEYQLGRGDKMVKEIEAKTADGDDFVGI